ncbi:MAG: type II toxin-antitoxin system PemK/MazF family toxin [Verrucomicrobia bacterium]|nr:type II toxin-antitoxin system PemK/MazF family toxin [Verrucomicrobiota bacterium]
MNQRKWDIWTYDFPQKGPHPVVLISHPDRCASGKVVNVLYCTSQRQQRPAQPHEVLLNSADGLEWETFCRCDLIYAVAADDLRERRGRVSRERRRAIARKLVVIFGLLEQV